MTTTPDVRPGQIWADNDYRAEGRQVRVDFVGATHADCTVISNRAVATYRHTDAPADQRGRPTRIKLTRFRPTSTGYRLVQDAPASGPEPDAITALRATIGAIHMHATGVAPVDLDREMDRAARLLDQLTAALTGRHDQCGPGAHTCTEGETR